MWYNFIDGRVLLVLATIGLVWLNYFVSDEYARRKRGGYDNRDMCLVCGEHVADPHAIGCDYAD
jgi:hypothetical protein